MKDNVILSSIVETVHDDGNGWVSHRFSIGGDPHAAAIVDAVNAAYPRPDNIEALLASLDGKPVTLLLGGENIAGAGSIRYEEAKLFKDGRAYLPKGKRKNGYQLDPAKVLDVVSGYNKGQVLVERVADVRARFPELVKLTVERLQELPAITDGEVGPDCTLAVFGKAFGGAPGSVWLLNAYDAEDDIVEGVLLVDPAYGGTSEHGSIYGRDLLFVGGEIVGFGSVTYADAVGLADVDFDDARQVVLDRKAVA